MASFHVFSGYGAALVVRTLFALASGLFLRMDFWMEYAA